MARSKTTRASRLIDIVSNLRQGVNKSDIEAQVILENLGLNASVLGEDKTAKEVLDELSSGDKTLKKLVNAASSYIRTQKKLDQLTRINEPQAARPGRGALSSGQAWGASGWRLTPTGFSWQRPPNVRATESFTPTPSTHIAKYDAATLTEGYSDQTTVVPYDPRFAAQQNAREALNKTKHQQRANTVWTGIRNLQGNFNFGGRTFRPWTDWQMKVFDFAKSHGLGTGSIGLGNASFILKGIARERGAETLAQMRSRRNYQRNLLRMTPRERERHELIMQYGGGPEGAALADEALQQRAERRHREAEARGSIRQKRERIAAEKSIPASVKITHKLLERIGVADRSTAKDIKNMAKNIKAAREIPVIGNLFKGSPILTGIGLGFAAWKGIEKITQSIDTANAKQVGWANAANLYGAPSARFQKAAMLAGVTDPGKIAEMFGQLMLQYGDPEQFIESIAPSMSGMTKMQKTFFAKALGLNPEVVAIMDMMAGNLEPSEVRKMTAKKTMADITSVMMSGSDKGFLENLIGILGSTSIGARMADVDFSDIAQSGLDFDASVANTPSAGAITQPTGRSISFSINGPVNVTANDAGEFVGSLVDESKSRGGSEILEALDITKEK